MLKTKKEEMELSENEDTEKKSGKHTTKKLLSSMKARASKWRSRAKKAGKAKVTRRQVKESKRTARSAKKAFASERGAEAVAGLAAHAADKGAQQAQAIWNRMKGKKKKKKTLRKKTKKEEMELSENEDTEKKSGKHTTKKLLSSMKVRASKWRSRAKKAGKAKVTRRQVKE